MGIVHRDLKPENLFLHQREDGTTILKIVDFGISKLVGGDGNDIASAGMTKTGSIMGTPLYMSPEQARGRTSEIGPATDVWAMGLIAMQLLSGEIYWRANTIAELMSQILAEPFYPPSQRWTSFGPAVDAWFMRSCAREPKDRFTSVGEQIAALAAALGGQMPALAPHARESLPSGSFQTGPRGASPSGPAAVVGARTTTNPISSDGSSTSPPGRAGGVIVGGLALVAVAAGVAFFVHSRAPVASASGDPADTSATTGPAATTAPPATTVAATADAGASTAQPPPTSVTAAATTTPAAATAVTAAHPGSAHGGHAPPKPTATAATAPVETPAPPKPQGPPQKPARFDPSGL
jgi:serine/threonine protein kinase